MQKMKSKNRFDCPIHFASYLETFDFLQEIYLNHESNNSQLNEVDYNTNPTEGHISVEVVHPPRLDSIFHLFQYMNSSSQKEFGIQQRL